MARNKEYKEKIEGLEEQVWNLSSYVQHLVEPSTITLPIEKVVPISNFDLESIRRMHAFMMQGWENKEWIDSIFKKGKLTL